jgi:hypothetical protein
VRVVIESSATRTRRRGAAGAEATGAIAVPGRAAPARRAGAEHERDPAGRQDRSAGRERHAIGPTSSGRTTISSSANRSSTTKPRAVSRTRRRR